MIEGSRLAGERLFRHTLKKSNNEKELKMNNDRQIDLIEEAFKNAHQEVQIPDAPDIWQSTVMASIQREIKAGDLGVDRTETIMFRLSWIAAGIAAILVLMFGLFFNSAIEQDTFEDDLQNLYVGTVTNEILTINSQ